MSDPQQEHRSQTKPYASLRMGGETEAAPSGGPGSAASTPSVTDYITAETERLENLKQALYQAFIAAPKSGIPTALVDLIATYTSALRLQLSIKGVRAVPPRGDKPAAYSAGRK